MSEVIPYSRQWIDDEDVAAVTEVLRSNYLTQGPATQAFEEALAKRFGVKRAVACSHGTAALHLAYAGLGVNERSLGIVPPITFAATANAFLYLGARVRFCDVDPVTALLSPSSLKEVLAEEEDTAEADARNLVTPVSFAGSLAPLQETTEIATELGFEVVEDAAHSPGAWREDAYGKRAYSGSCSHAQAAILSFHPVKHICAGEGGAVLTNDEELAERIVHLRSHGILRPEPPSPARPWWYEQRNLGWNYRLTDLQAALGLSQLKRLDSFLDRRRALATRYLRLLNDAPFNNCFTLPPKDPGDARHLFVIRFHRPDLRDEAHLFLKQRDVLTQIHYLPVYRHPYYQERYGKIRLPGAEAFFESCLSLPLFPKMSDALQDRVVETLAAFSKEFS